MADVMHAVSVGDVKRRRKIYLIDIIDNATRGTPHAAFEFSESTAAYLKVFKQAIEKRGILSRAPPRSRAGTCL